MLMLSLVATGFIGYMYMIILTMAIYVIYVKDSWSCESPPKLIGYTQIFIAENKLNKYFLNTAFIYFSGYFVCFLYSKYNNTFVSNTFAGNIKLLHKNCRKIGYISCISHAYTIWIFSINMLLIIISNISILNPGPNCQQNDSTCQMNGLSIL